MRPSELIDQLLAMYGWSPLPSGVTLISVPSTCWAAQSESFSLITAGSQVTASAARAAMSVPPRWTTPVAVRVEEELPELHAARTRPRSAMQANTRRLDLMSVLLSLIEMTPPSIRFCEWISQGPTNSVASDIFRDQ